MAAMSTGAQDEAALVEVAANETALIGNFTKGGRERVQRRAALSDGTRLKQQEQLPQVLHADQPITSFEYQMSTHVVPDRSLDMSDSVSLPLSGTPPFNIPSPF